MPIQFNCVRCNKIIQTPDDTAGKQCRCPDCGEIMPIPGATPPSETQSSYPQKEPAEQKSNPYLAPPTPSAYERQMHSQYEPSDRSGIVLVMGITSIVVSLMSCGCCLLFFPVGLGLGIPAWVMGRNDLRQISAGQRNPSQRGLLQAGMICGIVGVSLAGLSLIVQGFFMMLQFGMMGANGFAL